jgi:hypothetical protein
MSELLKWAEENDLTPTEFMNRVNEESGNKVIDLEQTTDVSDDIQATGGKITRDVTDEVKAGQEADETRDYEYFYNKQPERPTLTDYMASGANQAYNFLTGNETENEAQKKIAAYEEQRAKYETQAREKYASLENYSLPELKMLGGRIIVPPGLTDNELIADGVVKVNRRLFKDENGQIQTAFILVPPPDSSAFERMIDQATRNILTETLGVVERRDDGSLDAKILEESEFAKNVPDYDQSGAEGLFTTLLTYGLPASKTAKAGRTIGGAASIGPKSKNLMGLAGSVVSTSMLETVLSTEGDQGLFITPDRLQNIFPDSSQEELNDLALLFDGLLVNGTMDGLLGFGSWVMGKVGDKTRGARGLIDPSFVRNQAEREAVLSIFKQIDPDLANADKRTLAEGLRNLSTILDANSEVLVKVGQSSAEVPVDTVNAIRAGAEQYVLATYPNARRGMSEQEFAAFVEQKTTDMVQRTISLARSNQANEVLRQSQADMMSGVGNVIEQEAIRVNPQNVPISDTAENLVDQRQTQLSNLETLENKATTAKENFEAQAGRAVSDDPFIQSMISDTDTYAFFDESPYINQLKKLFGEDYVNAYAAKYKQVDEAYTAIPNVTADVQGFKDQLKEIFTSTGGLDQANDNARYVMSEIEKALGGKIKPKTDSLILTDDSVPISLEATPLQFLDAVQDDIGFADLYKLKKQLATTIGAMERSPLRQKIIELRDHITSREPGGQMAYVISKGGEAAELAQKADNLFIEAQSQFMGSQATRQLSDLSSVRAYQGTNTPVPEGGPPRGQVDLEAQSVGQVLPTIMADRTGSELQQLVYAMDAALSQGGVTKPILDLYEAQATDKLAKALMNNDQQSIDLINKNFDSYVSELRRLESPLLGQLEEAKRRIDSVQTDLGNRALAADELSKIAARQRKEVENNIVKDLIDRFGDAKSSPGMTLQRMISGDNAANNIKRLVTEIDKLPDGVREVSTQALQSTLLRLVRDQVFTSSPIGAKADQVDVALGRLQKITNERASGMLEAVAVAFPDDPFMEETLRQTLSGLGDLSITSRMKVARAGSDTSANLAIRDSVSTAILFSFGYMNPTAAAARRLTAGQIEAMEKLGKEKQEEILAKAMSAPKELAVLARAIAKGEDPKLISTLKNEFLTAAERTVRYEVRVGPGGETVDEQTESIFSKGMNVAGDAASGVLDFFR